jgi:uncharacterized protein affecting Mg2+/Co2+ transport
MDHCAFCLTSQNLVMKLNLISAAKNQSAPKQNRITHDYEITIGNGTEVNKSQLTQPVKAQHRNQQEPTHTTQPVHRYYRMPGNGWIS